MSKINIYGQLENQAVDLKLAVTRLIYDENFSKFLSDLNKSFIPLLSGTSLLRPTNPSNGLPFFDETLEMTIWYNDGVWIDSNGDNADIPRRGDTSERPNPSDVSVGFQYYDTTLKRLLTSNGTEWEVDTYTQGNGINIENGIISIKVDPSTETFLTLGNNGIKISGVLDALNTKVDKITGKSLVSDDQITKLTNLDSQESITSNIADAKKAGTDALSSLDSHTSNVSNPHKVTKDLVGLGNVDNTSDIDKPISNATKTALDDITTKISWLTIE